MSLKLNKDYIKKYLKKFISENSDVNQELNRINDLRDLNLLDTEFEEGYDNITKLVKNLFNVPIVLISLVDLNRQWFKSCIGLDVSETSREVSFCSNALKNKNKFYIIEDTSKSELYKNHPLVINKPFIKFYAGCILNSPNEYQIGTLCLIDTKPRILSEDDKNILSQCSLLVETEIKKKYYIDQLKKDQINLVEMIPTLNHELINLISPVISLTELLLINTSDPIELYKDIIHLIKDNIEYALNLLKQLQSMNNINHHNEINKKFISVDPFLKKYVILYPQIKLDIYYNKLVSIDSMLIHEVLLNLISNAVKYGDDDSDIIITVIKKDKNIIFGIKNIGIPIEENKFDLLFKKFSNNISKKINKNSNGLGLYICKNIIEQHDGKIWLDKNYKDGCYFKFSIPK